MIDFKKEAVNFLSKNIEDLKREEIESLLEVPPHKDMGDYAFPTFMLAKTYKKSPNEIAKELSDKIGSHDFFERIEAKGPYLNLFMDKKICAETTFNEIYEKMEKYGSSDIGKGKCVTIDFSSPNIAKPFHIGHLRSTVIGNSLYKIYKFLGFDAVGINHLGDYGTQFGMLIAAYKLWGDKEEIEKDPINNFLDLYVRYNELQERDPEAREVARTWFKKLENNDEEAVRIWKWSKDLSLKEFNKVYEMLGISFDSYKGEAFYSDKMPQVIEELREKKIVKMDQGAEIVDLEEYGMPACIIVKSNGTTTYATRDIAAAKYRKKTYDFYKNLYVVAVEQNLHFKQWKQVLKLMGYDWADDCIHVNFGMISMKEGSFSTRHGKILKLEDVLNKSIEKTTEIIETRNPNLQNKEEVAKAVGVGAIIFQDLFNQRIKDYLFDWDKILSFEGETAPYVQYTYARCCSLLDKNNGLKTDKINMDLIKDEAYEIIKNIYILPETIVNAMNKFEPFYITRNVIEISKAFNRYYSNIQIITEDDRITNSRLAVVFMVKNAIKVAMSLIGIKTPERM